MGGTFGYRPALDGVRALSIAFVLAFHLGAPWMEGGYLGVSVFFTLSGYLITALLLTEHASTGRIDVRAFYVRRLRRLLPASLLVLTAIAVFASAGAIAARADLRGGMLGALFQVANWEQLLGGQSYADLFLAPSPVDHFWSLAIEEQFYWLWPLAIAGLTAVRHRRVDRWLLGAFGILGVGTIVTAQVLGGDVAYFASWARFPEILAGAALAAVLTRRDLPPWAGRLAVPCMLAIVALASATPAGRGWAYSGGLPVFAVLSAGLVLGVHADGFLTRVLSMEPIPWIGRISYGLYLFHWPVFVMLEDASVGEKLATTFGFAVASYYLVERPIRTGLYLPVRATFVHGAAFGVVGVAGAVAILVPAVHQEARTNEPVVIGVASSVSAVRPPAPPPTAPPTTAPPTTAPPRPEVVALFGDSIADWLLRDAAPSFTRSDVVVVDVAIEGCDGAVAIPQARGRVGEILPIPPGCDEWPVTYARAVEDPALPVDVALLVVGNAPIVDRLVDGRWVGPCEEMRWYEDDITARIAYLSARVDRVVLVLPSWGGDKAAFLTSDDHLARSGCIRERLMGLAERLDIATIDLADVLCPAGPVGACSDLREADGTHVDPDDAPTVLNWLLDRS